MKNILFYKMLAIFLLISINAKADLRGLPQITILAASSLTEPLTEIARIYSANKNITVTTSFDDSVELVRKIDEGDSADIVITAYPEWMTRLKQKGVIDVYSLSNIIKNRLALVRSKYIRPYDYEDTLLNRIIQLHDRTIMVVADPSNTTLGQYTKKALERLSNNEINVWDKIKDKVMQGASGKNTLYLITNSNTGGIVYASDAFNHKDLEVISVFNESLHDPIIYQGAVVAGENMSYARDFMNFLQSNQANRIFLKYGFVI